MPVQLLTHRQTGAPTLSGTAGSLIALLNAVLLDGFNLVNVSSLTHTAGTATATYGVSHGLNVGDVIQIAGANEAAWNGKYTVRSITLTTVSFAVPLSTPASATGTLTSKIAPLTWDRPFVGTNKAVYRSADLGASGAYYRIDDASANGAHYAQVRMYEAMIDVDNGTDPTPTLAELPGGLYLCKSNAADATLRRWFVLGDQRAFWLFISQYGPNQGYDGYFMGDVLSWKTGDPYGAALWAKEVAHPAIGTGLYTACTFAHNAYETGRFLMRRADETGKAQRHRLLAHGLSNNAQDAAHPFPNPTTGSLMIAPAMVIESAGTAIRGLMPGLYQSYHYQVIGHASRVTIHMGGQPRTIFGINLCSDVFNNSYTALFDITGPWR